MAPDETRLGRGIYSVPEASRLTKVSSQRIRRWVRGYEYQVRRQRRTSRPVIAADYPSASGSLTLSFLDLIEVRFVNEFRLAGVSWAAIRIASNRAKQIVAEDHPFSTKRFRTDGKTILIDIAHESGEEELLDLVRNQFAFRKVIWPFLYKGLEFGSEDVAARWWPMDRRRHVVIDPTRSFGQPIVDREGVPTATLVAAYKGERSIERIATWFEISVASVRDAIDFERHLSAAA
jgi:uncharacterized protein (DUF433 family)